MFFFYLKEILLYIKKVIIIEDLIYILENLLKNKYWNKEKEIEEYWKIIQINIICTFYNDKLY
jgi:hypothetical protein